MGDPAETLLQPKQEKFARYYAQFDSIRKASSAAGIHPNTGSRFLKEQHVIDRISHYRQEMSQEELDLRSRLGVTYVLQGLKDLIEGEEVENAVKLKALLELGKEVGLFQGRDEETTRETPVKVFFGVDPARMGIGVETATAGEQDVSSRDKPKEESTDQTQEEEGQFRIIPIDAGVPVKKIFIPETGGAK